MTTVRSPQSPVKQKAPLETLIAGSVFTDEEDLARTGAAVRGGCGESLERNMDNGMVVNEHHGYAQLNRSIKQRHTSGKRSWEKKFSKL